MPITNGVVSVEDGVKNAQEFQPARKVKVELTFDVAEGADACKALEAVSATANAQVRALLHQAPETGVARAVASLEKAAGPAKDAGVNDPADVDAKIAAAVAKSAPTKAANRAKHAELVAPALDAIEDIEPAAPAAPAADIGDIEPDPEVTDDQVHEAIQKCNTRINDTAAIKGLIATYRTDATKPFSASMIPQASRSDFLAKLKELG